MVTPTPRLAGGIPSAKWLAAAVACVCLSAAAREPPTAQSESSRAREALARGDFDTAIAALESAWSLDPNPRYIYNLGRALESKGDLAAAHDAFLRAVREARGDTELVTSAEDKVKVLAPLVDQAVLRFSAVKSGSFVQVDGEPISDLSVDRILPPGRRTVCMSGPTPTKLACYINDMRPGLRLDWPPPTVTRTRLQIDLDPPPVELKLGPIAIRSDWRSTTTLELDATQHTIGLRHEDGRSTVHELDLTSSGPHSLRALTEAQAASDSPPGPQPEGNGMQVSTTPDSGPWPWVVVGTGAASLSVGVGLLVYQYVLRHPSEAPTQVEAEGRWAEANTYGAPGLSLVGAGAAAVLGGLVWYWVSPDGESAAFLPELQVTPDGGLVLLRGGF